MLSKYMKRLGKKQKEIPCCIFAEMGAERVVCVSLSALKKISSLPILRIKPVVIGGVST